MPSSFKKWMVPSRRQVLGMAGTCGALVAQKGALSTLLNGLVEGLIQKARAQGTTRPRNFLHLNLPGGPCRWFFDLPLKPYPNGGDFEPDPQIVTRLNDQGVPEYHTVPLQVKGVTLNMPTLWGMDIPTSNGGWAPLSTILEHLLMIRGVNMLADGHPPNNYKQVRPVQSMPSLTGLVADRSDAPIPAVGASPATPYAAYKSMKGIGQVVIPYLQFEKNPLANILGAFQTKDDHLPSEFLSRKAALAEATDRALQALGNYAKSSQPGAENLFTLRSKAEKLLRSGVGDLQAEYDGLLKKYASLIERCKTRNMPGINDRPIPHSAFPRRLSRTFDTNGKRIVACNADLRDIITEKTHVTELAEGFAIAEYLIMRGYSSTVLWGCDGLYQLTFDDPSVVDMDKGGTETGQTSLEMGSVQGAIPCDEHFTGNAISLVGNSFLYRSIGACLHELISVLKSHDLFSETVIQLGAEFSRIPRKDFGGSEHGWMANCTSLFSGAVKQPMVIGNILARGADGVFTDRMTTWGMSAPIDVDGTVQNLTVGNSTSTIAHLLRVAPPSSNNGPLVIENASGGLIPTVELAKNT